MTEPRWAVDGREHCKSFKGRPLADGFLTGLKDAVRDRPFNPRSGLPGAEMIAWYAHARAYTVAKWAGLAPVSRRSVAEALVTVTIALSAEDLRALHRRAGGRRQQAHHRRPHHPRGRPGPRR